ncbi:MAG: MarR family winged helix-turn-helix transcriptional regulator [Jatrophihabitans sp.]
MGFDLGRSLGFLAGQLSKSMTAQFNDALAEHGLTTTQWGVLACLWHEDGLTQTELSRRTSIDTATLAEMLKRMTARGLVRRERDPNNNRFQRVYLTSLDSDLRDASAASAAGINERALVNFSPTDRKQLIALLGRAIANLAPPERDL